MDDAFTQTAPAAEAETTTQAAPAGNGAVPQSVLERLRARRAELSAGQHLDLDVPGYDDPALVVRYRPLGPGVYARLAMLLSPAGPGNPDGQGAEDMYVDALAGACTAILCRERPGQEPAPLDPDGPPLRFDARLAELLEIPADSVRGVVRGVFGAGAGIGQHVMVLFGFSSDVRADLEETLTGESGGRQS